MSNELDEIIGRLQGEPERKQELNAVAKAKTAGMVWFPNPGAQTDAYFCEADELFYGGSAGGGKTDLLLGVALNMHRRALILRRLNGEVDGLLDRMQELVGVKGLKRNPPASYRTMHKIINFGGCQHLDDRQKYQGRPNDFNGFDEITNFLKAQYTFIIAWNRSTFPGQRIRTICTGNPPTTPEGMWVIDYWGPWLDKNHPNPALPGELRWFTTVKGKDTEVEGPGPVTIDGELLLDEKGNPTLPKSRTFIPAELSDNPDLNETGYGARLAGLPEELRASLKEGDFHRDMSDSPFQLFPSVWVEAAMARWNAQGANSPMNVLAGDIAQGGCFDDQTEILTDDGWKLFEDLRGVEKVLTLNGRTSEWGPIEQLHKYWHDGQMNLSERRDLSFCITDNHQLLAKPPRGQWGIKRYDTLPKEFIIPRATDWVGQNPEKIKFESFFDMPHGGVRLKKWEFSFEDWARFIGWFVSEGCAFKEKRQHGRWRVNISQNKGPKLDRISALLIRMGVKAYTTKSRSALEFSINSIGEHLAENCGVHAANKRIPKYIKEAKPEIIKAFLEEYRLGDGSINGSGVTSYSTTSKGLADDLHEVLAKLGMAGKIVSKHKQGSSFLIGNRTVIRKNKCFIITERSALRDCWILKENVQRIQYQGFVYCVSTPLKTILVRRKGTVMWSGNSDNTVLCPRHGNFYDTLKVYPGKETPDGPVVAGLIVSAMREGCEIIIDMGGGYGISTRDQLIQANVRVTPFNGANSADGRRDKSGVLKFANMRAVAHWGLRELLDPVHGANISLPPDPILRQELVSTRYSTGPRGVQIEEKDELKKRIGRSPDRMDAVILAAFARGETRQGNFANRSTQTTANTSGRNPRRR